MLKVSNESIGWFKLLLIYYAITWNRNYDDIKCHEWSDSLNNEPFSSGSAIFIDFDLFNQINFDHF